MPQTSHYSNAPNLAHENQHHKVTRYGLQTTQLNFFKNCRESRVHINQNQPFHTSAVVDLTMYVPFQFKIRLDILIECH